MKSTNHGLRATLFGGALLAASSAAFAQGGDEDKIRDFLNGTGRGTVSYEEFVASIASKTMRDLDLNHDGVISVEEAEAAQAQAAQGDPEDGVAVTGVIESNVDSGTRVDLDALKRSLGASPQMRSYYERLDSATAAVPSGSDLPAPRAFPQVRIRF